MKQSLQIWLEAARPKTLPLALVSILTGSVLAYSAGHFSLTIAIMAFVTATLLQILSNLANDYGDAVQGTDNDKRLGPLRAMQSGAVSAKQMKQAIIFNIVLTAISGLVLVFYSLSSLESIVTFIGLGILAILAAIAYTMGSKTIRLRGAWRYISVLVFWFTRRIRYLFLAYWSRRYHAILTCSRLRFTRRCSTQHQQYA